MFLSLEPSRAETAAYILLMYMHRRTTLGGNWWQGEPPPPLPKTWITKEIRGNARKIQENHGRFISKYVKLRLFHYNHALKFGQTFNYPPESMRPVHLLMINGILGLIYTSNFVGDFLLLTNANE